jgi:hypothetical protein
MSAFPLSINLKTIMLMRYFLHSLFAGVILVLLQSCDSCIGVDCKDNVNYKATLRIISVLDGRDLVFGPSRLYQRDKIRFFSIKGSDTTFFTQRPLRLADNTPDSALLVDFSPKSDTAFMQLTATDIDTVLLTYGEEAEWCCVFNVVTSLRFNNANDTLKASPYLLRK